MYSNRFAACILVDGKIQDELADGTVAIPYGTEYVIRLFNKHDRRASAKIFLDTENVSSDGFVVNAHSNVDIARRADRDTAFKFVPLGSEEAKAEGKPITNPGKEMGLIEVHFFLEKEQPKYVPPIITHTIHYPPPCPGPHYPPSPWQWSQASWSGLRSHDLDDTVYGASIGSANCNSNPVMDSHEGEVTLNYFNTTPTAPVIPPDKGILRGGVISERSNRRSRKVSTQSMMKSASKPEPKLADGCTVEGGVTGVNFYTVYMDLETSSTVLKLFLQGYKQPVALSKPKRQASRRSR